MIFMCFHVWELLSVGLYQDTSIQGVYEPTESFHGLVPITFSILISCHFQTKTLYSTNGNSCIFLLVRAYLVTQLSLTLCDPMDSSPPVSSVHGDAPGKNTGVGCHFLLQGIFSTQGSNPGLLHCRRILYQLSHQGSPSSFLDLAI